MQKAEGVHNESCLGIIQPFATFTHEGLRRIEVCCFSIASEIEDSLNGVHIDYWSCLSNPSRQGFYPFKIRDTVRTL